MWFVSARYPQENFQVVVVGGIAHMTGDADSLPSKLKSDTPAKVVSIGQRDAMYYYLSSMRLQDLVKKHRMNDLIVRHAQFALMDVKGVATIPHPPDYWIVVHSPRVNE